MNKKRWTSALPCLCLCAALALLSQFAAAQDSALREAKRLFARGSYTQSISLLQGHLRSNPRDADAHLLLGQILAFQGNRSAAIKQMTSVIELRPNSAETYDALGIVLNRFAEFPAASRAFERAVALNPQLPSPHIHLAMALAQAGNSAAAEKQLAAVIAIRPSPSIAANAHYLLGKILEDKDAARAIEEFTESTRLDPANAQAWLALGRQQRAANDQAAALHAFSRAATLAPADPEAQYELGSEYLAQGDAARAVPHLELARKYMPAASIAVLYKLDRALRRTGAVKEADAVRAKVQELMEQDDQANRHALEAQSLDDEGVKLEREGKIAEAAEKYRSALELAPAQTGFRLNYALALCRLDRWQQGISELNDIIESDPGNVQARRALYIARDHAHAKD